MQHSINCLKNSVDPDQLMKLADLDLHCFEDNQNMLSERLGDNFLPHNLVNTYSK